ncbi:MAG: hypothetical protein ISR65_18355 [Bacteriovoracaceae bacterium]|nr:hypothetical protein [Bacteriovoracaceae bacterium]
MIGPYISYKTLIGLLIFTAMAHVGNLRGQVNPDSYRWKGERYWTRGAVEDSTKKAILYSKKYRLGAYLIYDCIDRYYVCGDFESFTECKDRREITLKKKKEILACAPIQDFKTFDECFAAVYEKIHTIASKKFCLRSATVKN